jgi:hypothetical protein
VNILLDNTPSERKKGEMVVRELLQRVVDLAAPSQVNMA